MLLLDQADGLTFPTQAVSQGKMKLGSKYDLLDTPCNLKCKQIY